MATFTSNLSTAQQKNVGIIQSVAAQNNIPAWIPLTIALQESTLTNAPPKTDSNGKLSTGLFQLNQGGLGSGYSPQLLTNPALNTQIAVKAMVPAYQEGLKNNLSGYQLVQYVANTKGWPGNAGPGNYPAYDQGLSQAFAQVTNMPAGSGSGTTGTLPTVPSGLFHPPQGSVLTNAGQYIGASMWVLLGIVVVGLGLWVMLNPLSDLSTAIRSVAKDVAKAPFRGATQQVRDIPNRMRGEPTDGEVRDLYKWSKNGPKRPRRVSVRDIVGDGTMDA